MKQFVTPLIFLFLSQWAFSNSADSLFKQSEKWFMLHQNWLPASTWNPANNHLLPINTYRIAEINYTSENKKETTLSYQGNKNTQYDFNNYGFQRLKNITIDGAFQYKNGKDKAVQWSNVADYERLYPYILADSTMGNNNYEQYFLSGTYTQKINDFILATHCSYSAYGSYQTSDPRTKTTVSDLRTHLGIIKELPNHYAGISFMAGRYRQKAGSSSKKEHRVDYFYINRGLGNYDREFSAERKSISVKYHGYNLGTSIEWLPKNDNALWLASKAVWEINDLRYKSEQVLTQSNNRELDLQIGYRGYKNQLLQHITLDALWHKKNGKEYYYESVIVNPETKAIDYRLLSTSDKYERNIYQLTSSANFRIKRTPSIAWFATAKAGVANWKEIYRLPKAKQELTSGIFQIKTNWLKQFKASQLIVDAHVEYLPVIDSFSNVKNTLKPAARQTIPDFQIQSQDRWNYLLQMTYKRPLKEETLLNIRLLFHESTIKNSNAFAMQMAIGIQF
ncbi:hypothetical protein EMN47_03900 [Prolixibacteraceae bacterium JC049]|nr:hypothetical protein [Prolixibacteraceae bacterium JC049]